MSVFPSDVNFQLNRLFIPRPDEQLPAWSRRKIFLAGHALALTTQ